MQYEKELITLVKRTPEFTEIFHILDSYQLGKALICGGALRDLVWNTLSKQSTSLLRGNIDVLYGDSAETYEQLLTRRALLGQCHSKYLWNLQNVVLNNSQTRQPFGKTPEEALTTLPETCSAVAITFEAGTFKILAPFGLQDLFNMEVHPTPRFIKDSDLLNQFKRRSALKGWEQRWPVTFFAD
ncbi:nucleotidyltransferase family protein [Liquorilactobacillus satsumensis]|uniref:nucleotidyltransferase family protein n=1 Tax=Liquorilactobacillus satsumensis TaxID=259059 RepID=UPI0021C2FAD2|nr:nucleotidyltransferase family protein [Liquorilactobacillus satsumensis]MCP9312692.1 nucleotidyltransferase family protein [Liquorilactobacillus satsumensis]MCP9327529.1 nucleotidyltransferase family protein [Liquorilactobacillus satsumensis]MCP9359878.1 nucleotidyltransferase family protein [Liquorilactobacillus satsumensis]